MNAVLQPQCFHCGLPVPAGSTLTVSIDGAPRGMCCPGCAAVAQTIVDIGHESYYRERTGFAATAEDAGLVPPELRLLDADPRFVSRDSANDAEHEAVLLVEGIRCAACVWLVEGRLLALPGVIAADLNVATERLAVRWHGGRVALSAILQALRTIGYSAWPYDAARHEEQLHKAGRTLGRQLFVAGLAMMQVMMYVAPSYLAGDGTLDADMAALMRWASLLLTIPAVVYSAQPFFRGAWASLRARAPGMDVPVALGIAAAFGGSFVATVRGSGEVYFDSVTMFVFLLLASRWLELHARRKAASTLQRMRHGLPAAATRFAGWPASGNTSVVPAASLVPGDHVFVRTGEAFAADGLIAEGRTCVDLALLTGESAPQPRGPGDAVPGGAVNAGPAVVLRVTHAAEHSTLAGLLKLVERAGSAKPRIAQWADSVAARFTAALLLLALLVFVAWHFVDPARAWPVAIAVLVVSCPCALSLATPSALAAATDALLGKGVLVMRPHVLETLHRATHVVFDKTGTLTAGRPTVQAVRLHGGVDRNACIAIAAALEEGSLHPIGRAIAALDSELPRLHGWHARGLSETPGQGLEGTVQGRRYRLGNGAFVAALAGGTPPPALPDSTAVYLGTDGEWLACFTITDPLRPDAQATVDHFRAQGKQVVLLSGDRQVLADAVAAQLGIAKAIGDCLPARKLDYVQCLQRKGAIVAMVGDGINDAAVLSAADVSFAMGSGAALAQVSADTVLLNGQLGLVADTAATANVTMRVIRQNLAWASVYNAIAIPAAAIGLLGPWLSGVGMAASSALVILNALRLRYR
ncbi:heavy metal translocating P-type ATPase [Pseudoduganella albidiflava]|uniref:Cadmium-translocating P-type ATPase n=1 Tax=Pseudoduganella albidiflava TaxID=321983 RepID=A0A411X611_9BURK|nr:heavy metal translocating P-type ATPase [Pseudoduganella albidiflava]QBI04451.1 cadmium-translocating P-type ATPase [Pseudoduganella albidiflava]GGY27354.1 copper-translocating P-type ATPase [Pseudoduganella albidiflava]